MDRTVKAHSLEDSPELAMSLGDMRHSKTGLWRVMRPIIDMEACTRCLICWKFCPDVAIEIVDGAPRINYEYCKGCGICAEECPSSCISFRQEER